MDKTQAIQIASEALQLLKNSDIQFLYNPWQAFLSSKLVQYTTWSIVLVASSYSIGVFFEKVLPNLPYLSIFNPHPYPRRYYRNKSDSPYRQEQHDVQEYNNDDYHYHRFWPFNFLKKLNSSY